MKKEKGQSMVETAFVLPLILVLFIGIIDFSWLFYNKLAIGNSAREGARYASVYYCDDAMKALDTANPTDPSIRKNAFEAAVIGRVNSKKTATATYTTTVSPIDGEGYITIKVESEVPLLTPMFGMFFPGNKCHMESTVVMFVEQY